MAYFPFFIDIENKEGLIVGGGRVAGQKAEKLLPFGIHIAVIAPEIDEFLSKNPKITCKKRKFRDEDVEGKFLVIAATGDEALNAHISMLCRKKNILVNVVDDREKCGFLFPSLITRGTLTAGISTGGASPGAAVLIRKRMEETLPQETEKILRFLADLRKKAKEQITDSRKREIFLKEAANMCMQRERALNDDEISSLYSAAAKHPDHSKK